MLKGKSKRSRNYEIILIKNLCLYILNFMII